MSASTAKTTEKGPALSTEEPVRDTVGVRAGGAYDAIMALQRDAGNQAVSTLLAGSSGGPLDPAAREEMESRFGADFREVRIHRNESAMNAALAAGARAVTTESDIVFAPGYYAPATSDGKRLITHELAHVLQQRRGGDRMASKAATESEARQAGADAVAGRAASVKASAPAGPQADPMPAEEKQKKAAEGQGWNTSEARINFDIVDHVSWEASFMMVGGGQQTGAPGLGTWSNERVFTISEGEHSWLHLGFMADSKEHPIPSEYLSKMSIFSDVHYTPANGGPAVDLHLQDNQPQYRGAGTWLSIKLGFTAPGQSDLPICDLALDGGGELTWKAGFNFGGGGITYQVKKTFSLQKATAAPPQTGGTGSGTGTGTSGAAQKPAEGSSGGKTPKPQPLPGGSTPKPAPSPQDIAKANVLTEAIKQTQDAVKKDQLVKDLRDIFARIQPFMPEKDAKKAIDEAIDALVKTGIDEGIKAILRGIIGKDPSAVDPNRGPQTGPVAPKGFPSPQLKIPLPLPFDKPPERPKSHLYHFKDGLKKTYTPGEDMKFTVEPPDDFSRSENTRLGIVAEKDRGELNSSDRRLGSFDLESAKPTKVQMKAPEKPGKYVIRVETRGLKDERYSASEEEFEVTEAKKSQ